MKLGIFSSATLVVVGTQLQLSGIPLYMSPEQMALMQEYQRTGVLPSADFDPYVSDVYSLGLTFLHVALMEPPIKVLTSNRNAALTEYLNGLSARYPSICGYLEHMLVDDASQRGSFEDLLIHIHRDFPQLRGSQSGDVTGVRPAR